MPLPKIKPFLTGALFGVCVSFVAWRYHVVRYADGVMLVPRTHQPPIRSAYVDIREWGASMWKQYPEVAEALVSDGHSQLIAEQVAASLQLQLEDAAGSLELESSLKSKASSLLKAAAGDGKERVIPIRFKAADEAEAAPVTSTETAPAAIPAESSAAAARPVTQTPPPSESLKSALDALFAPYGEQPGAADSSAPKTLPPREEPGRNVVEPRDSVTSNTAPKDVQEPATSPVRPVSNTAVVPASAPQEPLMELESLDVELGEPAPFYPKGQVLPRRTGNAVNLSPTPTAADPAAEAVVKSL